MDFDLLKYGWYYNPYYKKIICLREDRQTIFDRSNKRNTWEKINQRGVDKMYHAVYSAIQSNPEEISDELGEMILFYYRLADIIDFEEKRNKERINHA